MHNLENIEKISNSFDKYKEAFKKKGHRLLEYQSNTFDRDFVEFNVGVSTVETDLQEYIDKHFKVIKNISDSLKLLRKFKAILLRENLKNGLEEYYKHLFTEYGGEI